MIASIIVTVVAVFFLICAECGEMIEGKQSKDHSHAEWPYNPTSERGFGMLVAGTTATTIAISGEPRYGHDWIVG